MVESSRPPSETTRLLEDAAPSAVSGGSSSDLKAYIRPLIAVNFMSIMCGLNDGNLGVIIPRLKQYYDIPNSTVSLLFLCNAAGFFLSASANGYLVHRIGQLNTFYLGSIAMLVAYLLLMNGFPFQVTATLIGLQGAGAALLDGGMNVYVANIPQATLMLNILHAIYGVGAMLSPLVGTTLLAHNVPWKGLYVFLAAAAVVNLVLEIVCLRNVDLDGKPSDPGEDQLQAPKDFRRKAIFNRMTLLGAAYILVYVGLEVTIGGWGYTYLFEGRHGDEYAMGRVVSGYWAGLAIGRVILGYVAGKYGEKRVITLLTTLTAALMVVLWWSSNIAVDSIVLVITGFLIAPMFPTTISLASKVLPREVHATSIGFMAAFGAGGAAFFPFVAGQVAGKFGILSFPLACLAMAVGMQVMWFFLPSSTKRPTKNTESGV